MSLSPAEATADPVSVAKHRTSPGVGLLHSERQALLQCGDAIVGIVSVAIALWLWTFTSGARFTRGYLVDQAFWFLLLVPLWVLLNMGLTEPRRAASEGDTLRGALGAALSGFGLYLGVYFFAAPGLLPRLVVLYFLWSALALELAWRIVYLRALASRYFVRHLLVVGTGRPAATIIRALAEQEPGHYQVKGVIGDPAAGAVWGVAILGGPAELETAVFQHGVTEIVLAGEGAFEGVLLRSILRCQEAGIGVVRMPVLYEELTGRVPVADLASDWILTTFVDTVRVGGAARLFRRVFDIASAGVGLAILALALPLVALAIWLDGRGPVWFHQVRTGRGGRNYRLLKFRTMVPEAESDGRARWAQPDDERVTRIGRILRRTRLDELPQFWNVLKGEMSLVGPRPERPEFIASLDRQIPFYRARLIVKPGITGWAQVNYRYGSSVDDALAKLEYDLYYIKHQSLWLDLLIVVRTLEVILGLRGV